MTRVAVPCHSFCRHEVLRRELLDAFPDVRFNDDYLRFDEDGFEGAIRRLNQSGSDVYAVHVLAHEEIEQILPSPVSSMPAGLLNSLTLEQVSDLFAYLGQDRQPNVAEKKQASKR